MSRWNPSPDEERWLAVAARLGSALQRGLVGDRAGGWRTTGTLARIALFLLGIVAAGLVAGILGIASEQTLLVAGLLASVAAEWLKVTKRMHASGVEEGLCVAGYLMIGAWIAGKVVPHVAATADQVGILIVVLAGAAAGLRLLNPFVTTGAALGLLYWIQLTGIARTIDSGLGPGTTTIVAGCATAVAALVIGRREFSRPSVDRMLDWLVATLPIAAFAQAPGWIDVGDTSAVVPGAVMRLVRVLLPAALGAVMLTAGLARRRHAPIVGFMGCVVCVAIELHRIFPLPTETRMLVWGSATLFVGMALDRYLRKPRDGITSARMTEREGPLEILQTAGVAALTHGSAAAPAAGEPTLKPGGGRYGGGGASGRY